MVGPSSGSNSLKEYLKRYESNVADENKKKKKKKKSKTKRDLNGVLVVDEDPVWQKPVQIEEEDEESQDEEKPVVDEDIEVKRMKRLEQLKTRRPYGDISEDGSGWVPVSADTAKSNSDISPQRKRNDTPSPETNSGDMSPPRKRRARFDTPSPEPNSDPDLSPPRKGHPRELANPDLSPPRKGRPRELEDSDLSPPRKGRNRELANSDLSPPRRGVDRSKNQNRSRGSEVEDLSPPRKKREHKDRHQESVSASSDLSPPRKPMKESGPLRDQPKTGLVTGKDMKADIDRKKKEDWLRFQNMDPSISGRNAEGVRRDKRTGERLTKEQIKALQKQDEKPKEIKLEWGKGLAQKREAEERLQELELEMDKPFARTRDDTDLNNMLKDTIRWGDPMAHLVKKKHSGLVLPDIGDNEKMKESGFIVPQEVPNHSWLKRGLDTAPNRYGIRPGRHWDGVDRSNGYEKQMFNRQNEKQATEREAYMWSVSDM